MAENIMATGKLIKCMERVFLLGLMVEGTKDNILMIKNKE